VAGALAAGAAAAAAVAGAVYALGSYRLDDPTVLPIAAAGLVAVALGLWRLEYGLALLIVLTPFAENAPIAEPGEARLRVALVAWAMVLVAIQAVRGATRLRSRSSRPDRPDGPGEATSPGLVCHRPAAPPKGGRGRAAPAGEHRGTIGRRPDHSGGRRSCSRAPGSRRGAAPGSRAHPRHRARLACVSVLQTSRIAIDLMEDGQGRNLHVQRLVELKDWARALEISLDRVTFTILEAPDPAAALVDYARHNAVDHIVMGARASSTVRRYLGSVSAKVVSEAPCSVTVVRLAGSHRDPVQQAATDGLEPLGMA
jgi:nucleotide-binding universal stress UspA family protein